jgi:hypothetical protein
MISTIRKRFNRYFPCPICDRWLYRAEEFQTHLRDFHNRKDVRVIRSLEKKLVVYSKSPITVIEAKEFETGE